MSININNYVTNYALFNCYKKYKLTNYFSILYTEMFAMKLCLQYIRNNLTSSQSFLIFTDSQSMIQI